MSGKKPLRIAVTGSLGQVGSAVVALALEQGHSVVAIDVPASCPSAPDQALGEQQTWEYRSADLTVFDEFKRVCEGCDALIHLAAVYSILRNGAYVRHVEEHDIHNANTAMSYNALQACVQLGIERIVLASSVNAIGMIYSKHPRFDYIPLDERHPFYPEDAYSLSKYFSELQATSLSRVHPSLRIASLRFHWVLPAPPYPSPSSPSAFSSTLDPSILLHLGGGNPKDLWGFVSLRATAQACLLGLTAPFDTFPRGHEAFFICADTTARQESSLALLEKWFPEIVKEGRVRMDEVKGNKSLISTEKARRMLGWSEEGFPWGVGA